MKIFTTDHFTLPLPPSHPFPMSKYARLRRRVAESDFIARHSLHEPMPARYDDLVRVHDLDYVHRMQHGLMTEAEMRRIGLPWSPGLVERSRRVSGATTEACRAALVDGWSVNLAGGTHHAYRGHGEGYCVFNDSIVAIRALQHEETIRRAVILDCDVHQGNGTASLVEHDPSIFAFSIHSERNYPLRKERSDLDIGLDDGADDNTYLDALERGLRQSLDDARAELAVYLAGADPYFADRLGRLSVTKFGLAERDRMVFDYCQARGIPVAVTMAGGYAPVVEDIVDIHFQTVHETARRA